MAGLGVNKMKRPGQKVQGPAAPYTGGDARPRPAGYGGGPPAPGATVAPPGSLSVSKVNKAATPPGRGLGARPPMAPAAAAMTRDRAAESSMGGGNGYSGAVPGDTINGGYQSVGGYSGGTNTWSGKDQSRLGGYGPASMDGSRYDPVPAYNPLDASSTTTYAGGVALPEPPPLPGRTPTTGTPLLPPMPDDTPVAPSKTTVTAGNGRIQGAFDMYGRPIANPTIEDFQNWGQTIRPPGMPVPTPRPPNVPGPPQPKPPGGGTTVAKPGGRPDRNDLGRPAGGVREFTDVITGSPMGQGTMQYAPGAPGDRAMTGSDPFGYGNSGMRNNGFGSPGYGVNPGMSAGVDAWGNEIMPGSPQDVATGNDSGGNNPSGGGNSGGGGGFGGGPPGGGTAGNGDNETRSAASAFAAKAPPTAGKTPRGLGRRPAPEEEAATRGKTPPSKALPPKGRTPAPAPAAPAEQTLPTPPPAGVPDPSATATPDAEITAQGAPAPAGLGVGTDDAAARAAANKAGGNAPGNGNGNSGITNGNRNVNLETVPGRTTVQDQLSGILDQDSVLMQQAEARGLQQANRRGLLNSSIAAGASQAALYDAAVPIASQQAQLSQQEREAVLNRNQATTFKDWELKSADRNAAATFLSNMEQIYGNMYSAILGNEKLGKGARRRAIKDLQREQDARQRAVEQMYDFNIQF